MALGLQSYDFLVSKVDATGKSSEALVAGAHAYAIPLSQCWTKTRAIQECWPVAKALMEALARNPDSSVLKADSTWICLHLAFDKQTGPTKKSARATFLSNIPQDLNEILCKGDFDSLALELGPEVMNSLRLAYDSYKWARSVLHEYGLIFLCESGEKVEALVPGVELFQTAPASEVPSPSDVRLETADGNFSEPTVVIYAKKNYARGDNLHWHSMRKYRPHGVPLVVKFPYADCGRSVMDNLCSLLGGSPSSKHGDSCAAEEDAPVEVIMEGGKSLIKVTLHLTQERPLPGKAVMSLIGVGILADADTLAICMKDEATIPGVMQEDQCDRRALRHLKPELTRLLNQAKDTDRAILEEAVSLLQTRLDAPWGGAAQAQHKSMKELLAVSPGTTRTVEWPTGTEKAVEALKASTKELQAMGSNPDMRKIQVMQTCLKPTIFGDPAAVPLAVVPSENPTMNAYAEAAQAEMAALAKCYEAESGRASDKTVKAHAISKRGAVQMNMNKLGDALTSFQQSLQTTPTVTTMTMAQECAKAHFSQGCFSELRLGANLRLGLGQLFKLLKREGYVDADVPVPARYPGSLSDALARSLAGLDTVLGQALSVSSEVSDLVELVRFFMLQRAMPVKRVRLLLGAPVCNALLEENILTCFDPHTAQATASSDAQKLISEPKSRGGQMIFSNVALQPIDGRLAFSDFDYGSMLPGNFEPEPFLAQDTNALAAAFSALKDSNVQALGSKTLVDSIPAGLAAAARGAKVSFAGSKRFLQLAELSCAVNGFQDCEFTERPSGRFDVVLSSTVSLPNPDMVIGSKGPMFKNGMKDTWSESLREGLAKLNPSGVLLLSSNITNSGASCKSKCEGLMDASCRAAIFTSKPAQAQDLLINLATGCAPVHHYAYMMGLQKAGVTTTSEAVIMAWKQPAGASIGKNAIVEMMPERKGLWADAASLSSAVQSAYDSYVQSVSVQQMVIEDKGGDSIYDFDWDEDAGSTTASDAAGEEAAKKEAVPRANPWDTIVSKKAVVRKAKEQERNEQSNGALWQEVANANVMGWAPPINLFSTWRISPYPQKVGAMPSEFPRIAIVELKHIQIPSDFMDAMRDTFDCKTKFSFSGEDKKFIPVAASKSRRRRRSYDNDDASLPIDAFPIIVVPIPPGSYEDKAIVDLPLQMIYFSQYFADKVRDGAQLLILTMTCNAFGPMMPEFSDTVSKAGALTGMSRTLRLEVKGLNMWNIDCDNFKPNGDSMEVMAQLSLELNCPDHNFEIAWRQGKRWIRSFELSARNPIRGPAIGPVFPWLKDEPNGVVFITGGLGGLGVVSAEALAEAGCKNIVLVSRSGKVTALGQGLEERIAKIQEVPGITLICDKCDTSNEEQVIGALERSRKLGPLKCIIHTAGVLADTILDFQNAESMNKSFLPKADGAWYLHNHTLDDNLTAFICFSSVSSLLGNPGQANYSSSNAYMDTLCRMRVYHGLPGIALMWPAVAEVGMAASGILSKAEFDENTQVKPDVVKTVMRLCSCNQYPLEPLVAVVPLLNIWPHTPGMALATEPLWTKYRNPKAYEEAVKTAEKTEEYRGALASAQASVQSG